MTENKNPAEIKSKPLLIRIYAESFERPIEVTYFEKKQKDLMNKSISSVVADIVSKYQRRSDEVHQHDLLRKLIKQSSLQYQIGDKIYTDNGIAALYNPDHFKSEVVQSPDKSRLEVNLCSIIVGK